MQNVLRKEINLNALSNEALQRLTSPQFELFTEHGLIFQKTEIGADSKPCVRILRTLAGQIVYNEMERRHIDNFNQFKIVFTARLISMTDLAKSNNEAAIRPDLFVN